VRESLLEHRLKSPSEINMALLESLRVWQGEHHRRDDLTFFCFRT
jgi:serine phosphatase RsbU (regulator of sigma subunit)